MQARWTNIWVPEGSSNSGLMVVDLPLLRMHWPKFVLWMVHFAFCNRICSLSPTRMATSESCHCAPRVDYSQAAAVPVRCDLQCGVRISTLGCKLRKTPHALAGISIATNLVMSVGWVLYIAGAMRGVSNQPMSALTMWQSGSKFMSKGAQKSLALLCKLYL